MGAQTATRKAQLTWLILGLIVIFLGLVVTHWTGLQPDWLPLAGFLGTLAGILFLFFAFGLAITGSAFGIVRDGQNTYSLSRLQMAAWTWLILSALIGLAVTRLWPPTGNALDALNIYIPGNLFIAMGISLFTGAAAPALLSLKTTNQPSAGQLQTARARMDEPGIVSNGQLIVRPLAQQPDFADIVEGDDVATAGTVDISKIQQLLITALLLGVYFAMLWKMFMSASEIWQMPDALRLDLIAKGSMLCGFPDAKAAIAGHCGEGWAALPDFPASLVTLLAISHGGYLAYKAVPQSAADNSGTRTNSVSTNADKAVG